MITLDDVARRAAADAHQAVDDSFDVDAGLEQVLRAEGSGGVRLLHADRPERRVGTAPRRRWTRPAAVLLAVAASVAVVLVAVIVSGVGNRNPVPADPTPPGVTDAPIPTVSPLAPTTAPASDPVTTPAPPTAAPSDSAVRPAGIEGATSVPSAAYEPTGLPWGSSVGVRDDGVLISLNDSTVTIHESPPRSFPLDAVIGLPARLVLVGPDDVAYVAASVAGADANDGLFAVSTSADNTGAVVGRSSSDLDGSGDTDLVAGPQGVVAVGCCGQAPRLPEPDQAPVLRWVDHLGEPLSGREPEVWVELRADEQTAIGGGSLVTAIVRRDGDVEQRWELEAPSRTRSMPRVAAADDGGVLVALPSDPGSALAARLVRGAPQGWVAEFPLDAVPLALEPSGSAIVWQADGTIARIRPFGGGPDAWTGDTVVDVEAGRIEAPGLNDLIDAAAPAWAATPIGVAMMIDPPGTSPESTRSYAEAVDADGRPMIVVVSDGLRDDSVDAVRHVFVFEVGAGGLYRLAGGEWANRCQPGRGHQNFSNELCV